MSLRMDAPELSAFTVDESERRKETRSEASRRAEITVAHNARRKERKEGRNREGKRKMQGGRTHVLGSPRRSRARRNLLDVRRRDAGDITYHEMHVRFFLFFFLFHY